MSRTVRPEEHEGSLQIPSKGEVPNMRVFGGVALRASSRRLRLRFQKAGLGASMVRLEFRPQPLPESLPLCQTRPRTRPDVSDTRIKNLGHWWCVANQLSPISKLQHLMTRRR